MSIYPLPCPVCGSTKICTFEQQEGLFVASCENDDCAFGVQTHGASIKEAIAIWNTRPAPRSEVQSTELRHYPRRTMDGGIEIVDRQFDFVRAVLPYNYAFTCNAQQWDEAERICRALEGPMISQGIVSAAQTSPHRSELVKHLAAADPVIRDQFSMAQFKSGNQQPAQASADCGAWQSIETAPRDGTPIEACNTRHQSHAPVIVRWTESGLSAALPEPHWCDAATADGSALYYNHNYFDFWKPTTAVPSANGGTPAKHTGTYLGYKSPEGHEMHCANAFCPHLDKCVGGCINRVAIPSTSLGTGDQRS